MRARAVLTETQAQDLAPLFAARALLPGGGLILGEITREQYDGDNAAMAGRWTITAVLVPAATAEKMRAAFVKASNSRKGKA